MRFFASTILILLSMPVHAQENLVPNGGFEQYLECPWTAGQIQLTGNWNDPNQASSDYFHSCSESNHLRPPEVIYGNQLPKDGEAFIGMYCFSLHQPELRDYAQTRLTEPLHHGVRYRVSFYVSLAELSLYAISSLGAHFSHGPLSQNDYWVIDVEPQIRNPAGSIIADTSGWVLVTDTFLTRGGGGEQWLTIGNFSYAADSDTFRHRPIHPDMGNFFHSYYYIDDVFVVALDSVPNSVAETGRLHFNVHPNPSSGSFTVRTAAPVGSGGTLTLHDAQGRAVLRQRVRAGQRSVTVGTVGLAAGVYTLRLWSDDAVAGWEKVVVQ